MKLSRIIILLIILLLLPFALKTNGQDFGRSSSLYSDVKAYNVGDLLTVLVYEQNTASNQVETKTEKSSTTSTSGGAGEGPIFKLIPKFGFDADSKNDFNGKGENLRQGVLRGKISVTVVAKKDNGDLVVEGSRVIGISGDRETMTLTGVVRQKDIRSDNTVDSYQIADAEIHYTGKGNANTAARPGFFSRILGWLF
ncbi:MAG: flagellar basal body L-ring protein FlgH [candidate division Zixibacteria bacterium]|nr:flagellar basal body L-ring protein FlgH [candidate division Zixibacteria bacterium]